MAVSAAVAWDDTTRIAVIGVDPGGTTGACVLLLAEQGWHLDQSRQFTDQGEAWKDVQELVSHYAAAGYEVHLVVEQFDKRPGIINPDYSAKYVEKNIDSFVAGFHTKYKQIPAEAKNFIREARSNNGRGDALKRFDMYPVGQKHARDAIRHALTYAVVQLKHRPLTLKGWPKPID